MRICILQRLAHAPWMSFAVTMGSVFPTLGCVTSSRTAGMGQMNLQLVASLVHSHLNHLYCLIARSGIDLFCIHNFCIHNECVLQWIIKKIMQLLSAYLKFVASHKRYFFVLVQRNRSKHAIQVNLHVPMETASPSLWSVMVITTVGTTVMRLLNWSVVRQCFISML